MASRKTQEKLAKGSKEQGEHGGGSVAEQLQGGPLGLDPADGAAFEAMLRRQQEAHEKAEAEAKARYDEQVRASNAFTAAVVALAAAVEHLAARLGQPAAPAPAHEPVRERKDPKATPVEKLDAAKPPPAEKPPDVKAVKQAAVDLSAATSVDRAVSVMKATTGAEVLGDVKPEQYAALIAAFKAALPAKG